MSFRGLDIGAKFTRPASALRGSIEVRSESLDFDARASAEWGPSAEQMILRRFCDRYGEHSPMPCRG